MKAIRNLLILSFLLNPLAASAGYVVEQSIEESNKSVATLVWNIDGDKFKLDVQTKEGSGLYIFNGRNFYICGALDLAKRKAINNFQYADNSFLKKISNGVCQTVSSNFMVRFFLSPSASIMTLDQSDRLNLSLNIPKHNFTIKNARNGCKAYAKNYKIIKKAEDNKETSSISINETGCIDENINWGKKFPREVQKVTLRQLKSKPIHKIVKRNIEKSSGFPESSTITYSLSSDGRKSKGKRTLRTTKLEKSKVSSKVFKIPAKFAVIDRDYLLEQIKAATPQKKLKSKKELNSTCMALSIIMPSFYWAFNQGCTETSVE